MSTTGHSYLISPQRLYVMLGDVQVIDVRERGLYETGHVPGAVHLQVSDFEWDEVLSGGMLVEHQLRDAEWGSRVLSQAGIQEDMPVVVYDQGGSYMAARMWWILAMLGHEPVSILNGGYAAWSYDLAAVEFYDPPQRSSDYLPRPHSRLRAEFSDVLTAQGEPGTLLCSTVPRRHFERGCIPGSMNLPYTRLFVGRPVPTIRRAFEAEAVFAAAGIEHDSRVIFYCESGYSASLALFCARLLGMERVSLYDGSMEDWSARGGRLE